MKKLLFCFISIFVGASICLAASSENAGKKELSRDELMSYGSRAYLEKDYKKAIEYYEKCIVFFDKQSKIEEKDKDIWLVLVDNLGMAYGISGNLEKSKETFEKGIKKNSKYPMFYYNLACTYGEMKNLDKAIENLKKTYEYKGNMIEGETIPDPKEDSSFKGFLKEEKFIKFLKEIWNRENNEYGKSSAPEGALILQFKGKYVADRKSGLSMEGAKEQGIAMISSVDDNFGLAVPYSENWELRSDKQYIFFASNGVLNVSVEILNDKWKTEEDFLKFRKDDFLKNKEEMCVIDAKILKEENGSVMKVTTDATKVAEKYAKDKTKLDPKFKNLKQISYYSSKKQKSKRLVLHISVIEKDGKTGIKEETILFHATSGLMVEDK